MSKTQRFTLCKEEFNGLNIDYLSFNYNEFEPEKAPLIMVPLKPLAIRIGVNDGYFERALRQERNESLRRFVKEVTFFPSDFDLSRRPGGSNQPRGRGDRAQVYSCLSLRKVHILLNGVKIERLKDPKVRKNLKEFQESVNVLIEHYYHDGGAINPASTPEQKKTLKEQLEKENAELREENSDLRSDVKDLIGMMREQQKENQKQSKAIDGLVSTVGILRESQERLEARLAQESEERKKETQNRTAAVARENKERKGRRKAENLVDHYEDLMTEEGVSFSAVKKKVNKEFDKNYDANW